MTNLLSEVNLAAVSLQLLRKLQRSIATLQTCGEWGGPPQKAAADGTSAESALELQTERIWMEARAPQQQLFTLTVRSLLKEKPYLLSWADCITELNMWATMQTVGQLLICVPNAACCCVPCRFFLSRSRTGLYVSFVSSQSSEHQETWGILPSESFRLPTSKAERHIV